MAAVLLLLLLLFLLLLGSAGSLPAPRTSFLLDSSARPLLHFGAPDLHNTTALLLSADGATLYVGARDAVLSLDVSRSDAISLKGQVRWSPSEAGIQKCREKGKSPTTDCLNRVHVLQAVNSSHLYACGSFAFSPQHVFIDTESFSLVGGDAAKGHCPFSAFERSAAAIVDGELFTATTADFRGVKPQISRFFSGAGRPDVSLDSSLSLLDEPVFVGSSVDAAHGKLYFFFSEVGKEFSFVDELRIARVAQVCKDDVGGQRTLQKKWTSFAKASLLCQSARQLPFNVLQDVFALPPPEGGGGGESDTLFYGVFASQWSAGSASAVCVFGLRDIRTEFAGSYRTFDMQSHQWSPLVEKHSYLGQCGLAAASSDSQLEEVRKSFLTGGSVKPVGGVPLLVSSQQRYSRVAAMRTQAADGKLYTVLFLLTDSGFLHKLVLLDDGPQIAEEIQVFARPQPVKSLVLAASKGVLYVGTSEGVTAVPVSSCAAYRTCGQCLLARDPLCGWSLTGRVCARLSGGHRDLIQNLEVGGDVGGACGGQPEASRDQELAVRLGDVVRLPCPKPSNRAVLTWTSDRLAALPERLFIQSADGGLGFLATADTVGTYRCVATEGRHREVVAGYALRQVASPRSPGPQPELRLPAGPETRDEPFQDMEEPTTLPRSAAAATERDPGPIDRTHEAGGEASSPPTSGGGERVEPYDSAREPKSYYTELVVVSLLLVTCAAVLLLGALYVWRRRKRVLDAGRPPSQTKSLEICSLRGPEDAGPEVKVQD